MKAKKLNIFKKAFLRYRQWRSDYNRKILNIMIKFSMFEAIRLANRKRDIINNKVWVIAGPGEFLVFARYQKLNLIREGLLKKNLSAKELDEKASYIAYPISEKDKRKDKIRIFK